jgi:hypothetical protein
MNWLKFIKFLYKVCFEETYTLSGTDLIKYIITQSHSLKLQSLHIGCRMFILSTIMVWFNGFIVIFS